MDDKQQPQQPLDLVTPGGRRVMLKSTENEPSEGLMPSISEDDEDTLEAVPLLEQRQPPDDADDEWEVRMVPKLLRPRRKDT